MNVIENNGINKIRRVHKICVTYYILDSNRGSLVMWDDNDVNGNLILNSEISSSYTCLGKKVSGIGLKLY